MLLPYTVIRRIAVMFCVIAVTAAGAIAAGPAVTVKKTDATTVTGTLEGLKDGSLILATKPEEGEKADKNVKHEVRVSLDEIVVLLPQGKPAGGAGKPTDTGASNRAMSVDPPQPQSKPSSKPQATQPSNVPATTQAAIRCELQLVTGDHLRGTLVTWTDKQIAIQSSLAVGEPFEVPVSQVRAVWLTSPASLKIDKSKPQDGPEDTAYVLKDGGVVIVRGVVLGMEGQSLRFKFNDQERKIGFAKLAGVALAGQEMKADDSFRLSFQLAGGEAISGTWASFEKNTVGLETSWGAKAKIPFAKLSAVRGVNGRLVYVSDLKPSRVEQTPFFDRLIPWKADHSLTDGPIKLVDGTYTKGLAVHSRCVLEYEIESKFEIFAAKVGFQQPEGRTGQAVVRVLGDGRVLYEDLDARGNAPQPAEVRVSVTGVKRLTLEVDFGKNEDTGDRVVWANARLLRAAGRSGK